MGGVQIAGNELVSLQMTRTFWEAQCLKELRPGNPEKSWEVSNSARRESQHCWVKPYHGSGDASHIARNELRRLPE